MIMRIDVGYPCKGWVRVVGADACPINNAVVQVHQRGDDDSPPPSSMLLHGWEFIYVVFGIVSALSHSTPPCRVQFRFARSTVVWGLVVGDTECDTSSKVWQKTTTTPRDWHSLWCVPRRQIRGRVSPSAGSRPISGRTQATARDAQLGRPGSTFLLRPVRTQTER